MAISTSLLEYPHSLSYQAKTLTKLPPTTRVISPSIIAEYGVLIISDDTNGSSVYVNKCAISGFNAAALKASFISSGGTFFLRTAVMSEIDPETTGTLNESPSKIPFIEGIALPVA